MNRAEQALAYCSALLGGPDGDDRLSGLYVTVWTVGDKTTRWRRADQPGAIASTVAELDEQGNAGDVYMGTTLAPRQGGADERPKAAECAGLVALWLDLDVADAGHKDARYPDSVDKARRVVDALRLPPTMIVGSGGGLHAYWVLTEPWLVREADDPDAERKAMAALVREWQSAARYHAERLGRWKVDSTHDLTRLLRPAGTTNRKLADRPRAVTVLHHDPAATYNPGDFAEYLPDAEILAAYTGSSGYTGSVALDAAQQAVLADVNFAAVWARVNSAAYRERNYVPEWLADILEAEAENGLAGQQKSINRTWEGDRPDLKGDQSKYDAALIKLLAAFPFVDTEGLIEALMCRRIRSGVPDKINPSRRVDYIARTVAKFRVRAQHEERVRTESAERIARMAELSTPSAPDPAEPQLTGDSEQDFADYTAELIQHQERATDSEHAAVAREALGIDEEEDPGEEAYFPQRGDSEEDGMAVLSELLIPEVYRNRGVQVWALEYRDYGEQQRGRMLLRLPTNFAWPINPPARYRPGRPLPTEWLRRDLFEKSTGFRKALERDCLISARTDSSAAEWEACIHSLVPLWRRDSSGGDVYSHARQWLYSYLMEHTCTSVKEEALATGRPWLRHSGGWKAETPPEILVDLNQVLDHCRRQAGSLIGRSARGLVDYLRITPRRPRITDLISGRSVRPEWFQIDHDQFEAAEWRSVIEVARHACETSEGKRRLRAVEHGGIHLDGPRGATG